MEISSNMMSTLMLVLQITEDQLNASRDLYNACARHAATLPERDESFDLAIQSYEMSMAVHEDRIQRLDPVINEVMKRFAEKNEILQ